MANNLYKIAKQFQVTLAQAAPNLTPEQVEEKRNNFKLQDAAPAVINSLAEAVGLHNMGPYDMQFVELKLVNNQIVWRLKVATNIAKSFNDGVAKMSKSSPGFDAARYVKQLWKQKFPQYEVASSSIIFG
jgi:hypothetical protein